MTVKRDMENADHTLCPTSSDRSSLNIWNPAKMLHLDRKGADLDLHWAGLESDRLSHLGYSAALPTQSEPVLQK